MLALATIAVVSILVLFVYERGRGDTPEEIYDWQINAFSALTGADQAIYNALYSAKDDIPYIYEDLNMFNAPGVRFRWPNLHDLQDALLPPFYRDKSWQQNGSIQWTLHEPLPEGEMQGSTMYLGTDGQQPQQGSFLLVIGHVHAGFRNTNSIVIWWNRTRHVVMPQNGFRDRLILQGWREVVPYDGAQEVKRIFGDDRGSDRQQGDQDTAEQSIKSLRR